MKSGSLFASSARFFTSLSILFALSLSLTACSSLGLESEKSYENKDKEKLYRHGSLVSDEGGFSLLGGGDKKSADGGGLGVNGYLWRATLDTIAFMPIVTADPFGGVITTDWYSAPNEPDERMKLNVFILDRDLRADGVRVSAFRQTRGADGSWSDAAVSPATAGSLENTILTRARQMRLAQREAK
ncbi:MAG: DUF3576 domain-containing protein [Alphaproteobacteria bacterium]|nr:DUF3576 domain-containing protein [Alphaproteobacteria bacterium]